MRMSPWSQQRDQRDRSGRRPAGPALTIIMILRGAWRASTSSSSEWQPTNFLPLARPAMNSSTLLVVRLKTAMRVAAALDVESQVLAHHGEADEAEVALLSHVACIPSRDSIATKMHEVHGDRCCALSAPCVSCYLVVTGHGGCSGRKRVEFVEQLLLVVAGEGAVEEAVDAFVEEPLPTRFFVTRG